MSRRRWSVEKNINGDTQGRTVTIAPVDCNGNDTVRDPAGQHREPREVFVNALRMGRMVTVTVRATCESDAYR